MLSLRGSLRRAWTSAVCQVHTTPLRLTKKVIKSRLGRLAEDAALITGSSQAGSADSTTDPTVVVADRRIVDALRRGAFDNLGCTGKPLKPDEHKASLLGSKADAASYLMAKQLAAAKCKPLSLELREKVQSAKEALVAAIKRTVPECRADSPHLRTKSTELRELIKQQHLAAIADAHAYGMSGNGLQVHPFDFNLEISRVGYEPDL